MPDRIARLVVQEVEPLSADEMVGAAVRKVIGAGLPGLPVVESDDSYAGVFGAHEFLSAYFPRYLGLLHGAKMISAAVDEGIERRPCCAYEPVRDHLNTDHVVVTDDYSDTQLAELFLHHRVQIIPISSRGRIHAVVPLDDFFRALGERLPSTTSGGLRTPCDSAARRD